MKIKQISSIKNELIKYVIGLQSISKLRRTEQLFFVEGEKEIDFAVQNGFEIKYLFFTPMQDLSMYSTWINENTECIECSAAVFEKLVYRESTVAFAAIFHAKKQDFNCISFHDKTFVLVIDKVEKPGNLGAILRTADATKADAVIVCDTFSDIYNPNVIRSSVGCVFNVPIVIASEEAIVSRLKKEKVKIFTTDLSAEKWHFNENYTQSCAIVLGSEAQGVSDFWLKNADVCIKIPMLGSNDSLNVSNAAAVLAYEIIRQRMP